MSDEISLIIEKLSHQLSTLKNQRDTLNEEARSWAHKRDGIHKHVKDLQLAAATLRDRRDDINTQVRALKTQRDLTRALKREKIEEIQQLKKKHQMLTTKQPKRALEPLKKELEKIEWAIQTTSLTLEEEKPLVHKANTLRREYDQYTRRANLQTSIEKLTKSLRTMDEEAEVLHKQLTTLALQSQQLHDRMIETLEKTKALKIQADESHQSFVLARNKAQTIHSEYSELAAKMKTLKMNLREITEKSEREQQSKKRKRLKEEAARKMKDGGKLTLEEFKLLVEKEKN